LKRNYLISIAELPLLQNAKTEIQTSGISIANLINLINIEVVIVDGRVTNAGKLFLAPLQPIVSQ